MEEADMRLGEMKKTAYEFERDIVKGSVNQRTSKVIAEKVQRYFEDKIRARVRHFKFKGLDIYYRREGDRSKCQKIRKIFVHPPNSSENFSQTSQSTQ